MPAVKVLTLNYAYVWAGIEVLQAKSTSGLISADSQNVNIFVTNSYNKCLKNKGFFRLTIMA
jgi:hypothetical protein